MKKLISILSALAICTSMVTAVNANALTLCTGSTRYEECVEVMEYLETPYTIYKSKYNRFIHCQSENFLTCTGTFHLNFGCYIYLSDDEFKTIKDYMAENYPEVSCDTEQQEFNFASDVTYEEKLKISKEIKEATGFICDHYYLMDIVTTTVLGDLNADNTITASDAAMALSCYASGQTALTVASDEETVNYSLIADYNNDGMVTAVDAALILSDYAKGQVS